MVVSHRQDNPDPSSATDPPFPPVYVLSVNSTGESLTGCKCALRALLCPTTLPICSQSHARFYSAHCLILEELGLFPDIRDALASFLGEKYLPVPISPSPTQDDDCLPALKMLYIYRTLASLRPPF